jgi:hypothetical protein
VKVGFPSKHLSVAFAAIGVTLFLAWEGITLSSDPSPVTEVSTSPGPSPETSPSPTLSPDDARSLRREFERGQAVAKSALLHRQKLELQELRTAQKAMRKEWLDKERTARHQFLGEGHKGPEIRVYMRDYQSRLRALDQGLAEKLAERKREHKARFEAEVQDHSLKHREFVEFLGRGERPPESLWPTSQ